MPITFYTMGNRCGFCVRAEKMFAAEIENGEIIIISASKAPSHIKGFPTFMHKDKTHSGLPSSKEELYAKLEYSAEYYHTPNFNCRNTPTPSQQYIGVL